MNSDIHRKAKVIKRNQEKERKRATTRKRDGAKVRERR